MLFKLLIALPGLGMVAYALFWSKKEVARVETAMVQTKSRIASVATRPVTQRLIPSDNGIYLPADREVLKLEN